VIGQSVILTTRSKRYTSTPGTQIVNVMADVNDVNFAAQEGYFIAP
jgi:hypothetical protein